MGFRTLVVFMNDRAQEWQNDPELGKKIMMCGTMVGAGYEQHARMNFPYGEVVEQVHGDVQTLIVVDGYGANAVTHTHWHHNQTQEERDLVLLRQMAEKMGYTLHKKPAKK